MNQHVLTQFHPPPITGSQRISNNTSSNTPLLGKVYWDLDKLLPLLYNLKIQDDTLVGLKIYYGDINLYLNSSINQTTPICPHLHQVYPNNPPYKLLVTP